MLIILVLLLVIIGIRVSLRTTFYDFQDPNRAGDAMSSFEGEAKGNILAGDGGILSDVISTANRALVNCGVVEGIHTHHIIMTS